MAIALICMNIIHECTFKSTPPLELIGILPVRYCACHYSLSDTAEEQERV